MAEHEKVALINASKNGDEKRVDELIKAGASLNAANAVPTCNDVML